MKIHLMAINMLFVLNMCLLDNYIYCIMKKHGNSVQKKSLYHYFIAKSDQKTEKRH